MVSMCRNGLERRKSTYGSGGLGLVDSRVDRRLDIVARRLLDLLLASRDETIQTEGKDEDTVATIMGDKRWTYPSTCWRALAAASRAVAT